MSNEAAVSPAAPGAGGGPPAVFAAVGRRLARYGVLLAIVATFTTFSVMRPNSFFTALTIKGILRDCMPLMIVALGITVVLAMNDYDLSVGGLTSLCAVTVVVLLSTDWAGLNWLLAVFLTIVIGGVIGLVNGALIAYVRLPSFILTIATGTVFGGLGLQIVNSQSVYQGISQPFIDLASGTWLGLSHQVFIGLGVVAVAHLFLRHTEYGRHMYAIGGNPEAARLSGLRVQMLRTVGFGIVGISAAMAAILINSEAAAANPNTGIGLLLPAYAAAFLGSSMFHVGIFTPIGTALGALYLQIVGTGLTILNLTGPVVQMIQGAILVAAILVSRLTRPDEH